MIDKVLLIGLAGAGTSTVGTLLAARLGWPYLDNDSMLERATGRSAAELVAADGEDLLREAEGRVLTLMLGMPGPLVAGLPAGVVLAEADRQRLASCDAHVVWLRATVPVLVRRIAGGPTRGVFGVDPAGALRRLAAERNPLYQEVADQVVDVDALQAGAIAKLVVAALDSSE